MTIRALADKKFLLRYLLLALFGLGICLWGVYDSIYKFPKDLAMAKAFDEYRNTPAHHTRWKELYEQNKDQGWPREPPKHSEKVVRGYIAFNNAVIFFGLGLMVFFLVKYFRTRGSWVEATETGIRSSWGQSLEFAQISKINKRKWEDKGIAKVFFDDAEGRRAKMILDDFKYERAAMAELMARCEQGLSPDCIVGGKSQAEIAEETAAARRQQEDPESD